MNESGKSTFIGELNSISEPVRIAAYHNIIQKNLPDGLDILRNKCNNKETSPNALKMILSVVSNYVTNQVECEHMEIILKYDWKKAKTVLQDFVEKHKLSSEALDMLNTSKIINNSK